MLLNCGVLMMYSEYKLNKQGDSIQALHTLFPILNQSIVPCLVLTESLLFPGCTFAREVI